VTCAWSFRGTDEDLIAAAQSHGGEANGVVPTPEKVLAVATPVADVQPPAGEETGPG